MKSFLAALAATTALTLAASAQAQTACVTAGTTTTCDPTSFHVSSPGATGTDPVLLNEANTFTLTEVGNKDISPPVHLLFIEPVGTTLDITGITGQMASLVTMADPTGAFSFGATSITALGQFNPVDDLFDGPTVTLSAGQDLVKQIGFNGGAASISYQNISDVYGAQHPALPVPTTFDVFEADVPIHFTSDSDFLTATGDFGLGTVISAIALDINTTGMGKTITVFDNSWTNAGFVNTLAAPGVPEAPTWAMMLSGLALVGLIAQRRRRDAISIV